MWKTKPGYIWVETYEKSQQMAGVHADVPTIVTGHWRRRNPRRGKDFTIPTKTTPVGKKIWSSKRSALDAREKLVESFAGRKRFSLRRVKSGYVLDEV